MLYFHGQFSTKVISWCKYAFKPNIQFGSFQRLKTDMTVQWLR